VYYYLRFRLSLAAAICIGINSTWAAAADEIKAVDFPTTSIGQCVLYKPRTPMYYSERAQRTLGPEARKEPVRFALKGGINYSASVRLGVGLYSDERIIPTENVRCILPLAPDTDSLVLTGRLNASGVNLLSEFTKLRRLDMVASEELETEAAALIIGRLESLESLGLGTDNDLVFGSSAFCRSVANLKYLVSLSIPCEKLTHADIEMIASNSNLQCLHLRSRRAILGPKSVRELGRLTALKELHFVCTPDVTVADFEPICRIKSLESLAIATDSPIDLDKEIKRRRPDIFFFVQPPSDEFQ